MAPIKVYLIGSAPGVGKTTLGSALAAKLGMTSLSIDDLMTAAQAVTTSETHPDLHVMRRSPSLEYFTNSTVEQLKTDATMQHFAVWPMVREVILRHADWGSPVVIDGWHIRPQMVADLNLANVGAVWIVAAPSVLIERETKNTGWLKGSEDPDRMLENFLARSLWYNDLVDEQVTELGLNILRQDGDTSVDELCELILAEQCLGVIGDDE